MPELPAVPLPEVGDVVCGKYRILNRLGAGGMAVVYEAEHVGLRRRVAIKMLVGEAARSKDAAFRFGREARAAAQLESPHIARVLDVDILPSGAPVMVLELLRGHDLGDELDTRGALPVMEAVDVVRQAALGMCVAHSIGVVHRDLKPNNLFLCESPEPERHLVKVLDFGISKFVQEQEQRITRTREAFGTPQYMSPEQIRATRDVDGRSDVWALGVVLYECLTGRAPFEGSPTNVIASIVADPIPKPSLYREDIPPELEAIILHCLEKDPDKRLASAEALAAALEPFAPAELIPIPPASQPFLPMPLANTTPLPGELTPPPRSSGSRPRAAARPEEVHAPTLDSAAVSVATGHPGRGPAPLPANEAPRSEPQRSSGGGRAALALVALLTLVGGGFFYMQRDRSRHKPPTPIETTTTSEPEKRADETAVLPPPKHDDTPTTPSASSSSAAADPEPPQHVGANHPRVAPKGIPPRSTPAVRSTPATGAAPPPPPAEVPAAPPSAAPASRVNPVHI